MDSLDYDITQQFSSFGFLMVTLGPLREVLPAVLNKHQAETNIVSSTALIAFCFASELSFCSIF